MYSAQLCTPSHTPLYTHHHTHLYTLTPLHAPLYAHQDFTNDKIVAEATLATRLGTLRYLKQLQATRQKQQEQQQQQQGEQGHVEQQQQQQQEQQRDGGPVDNNNNTHMDGDDVEITKIIHGNVSRNTNVQATTTTNNTNTNTIQVKMEGLGDDSTFSVCPVCHDELGNELVMLSCGHQLCTPCSMMMLDKLPKQTPKVCVGCVMWGWGKGVSGFACHATLLSPPVHVYTRICIHTLWYTPPHTLSYHQHTAPSTHQLSHMSCRHLRR